MSGGPGFDLTTGPWQEQALRQHILVAKSMENGPNQPLPAPRERNPFVMTFTPRRLCGKFYASVRVFTEPAGFWQRIGHPKG